MNSKLSYVNDLKFFKVSLAERLRAFKWLSFFKIRLLMLLPLFPVIFSKFLNQFKIEWELFTAEY